MAALGSTLGKPQFWALLVALAVAPLVALVAVADDLWTGMSAYTQQAITEIDSARDSARRMREAVAYGNADGAQRAWIESHASWERAETFTTSLLSQRGGVGDGGADSQDGYRSIEPRLFSGQVGDIAPDVNALVQELEKLSTNLRNEGLSPQGLVDGAARVAFETGEQTWPGGPAPVSAAYYFDMKCKVAGIRTAFSAVIGPALKSRDQEVFNKADEQLSQMEALLQPPDPRSLDRLRYRKAANGFATTISLAATKLGLKTPALGY